MAEAILTLSGTCNGRSRREGPVARWSADRRDAGGPGRPPGGDRITFQPTRRCSRATVITSPEWSGSETGGRRYSPFVVNVERKKPWHTLTGRMHFFLDHDWMPEYGEALPVLPAATGLPRHFGDQGQPQDGHGPR